MSIHTPSKTYRHPSAYHYEPDEPVRDLGTDREWVITGRLWNHDPAVEVPAIDDHRQYVLVGVEDPASHRLVTERELHAGFERVPTDEFEDGDAA